MPGMLQLTAYLRLLDKSSYVIWILLVLFKQDFQRQISTQIGVVASNDRSHATPGDFAQ